MSNLRLAITGATGFIGSRLALHAHRAGIDVLAAGRIGSRIESERAEELRAAGVRQTFGTLQSPDYLRETLMDRNCVIHLAAAQHEAHMPPEYFREVNVAGTRALLEAARELGIRRFVYGSSIGVYGSSAEGVLDETSAPRPDNIYTRTKLEAEQLVASFAAQLQVTIVRISETYGPSDFRLLKLFRAIDRGHFVTVGAGLNRRQCLHVNDLTRALLLVAEHPLAIGQTFVIAGAESMTTREMVQAIAGALNRAPPRLHAPLWPFKVAATFFETVCPPLGIQPPLHHRRLDFFTKSFVFSTTKAQTLLGFQPEIDFTTGAADTVRWYRARGFLPRREAHEIRGAEST